jgi:ABC-2 type transport system ATP-binding protein
MKSIVVKVEDLHFEYRVKHGNAKSLKQAFINKIKRIESDVLVHAVNGISFSLGKGEILGIVGKNGAGKSTLLKLLAGILPQTSGVVHVDGRVAPLIELGAGFNQELTGTENIILFGVLLGNSRKLMNESVAEISAWAGIGDSINLPVRTYSTGMLSRLGFAVATFQSSELLIIDEVLSVGDSDFQRKSLKRVEDLISEGEAAILVSHDLKLIEERSTKVLWLEQGKQIMLGNPSEVINEYKKS